MTRQVDVLVVGGGQAGLATAYELVRAGQRSVLVLEAAAALGQSWRDRWDSLVLFTPRRFSSLPGLRFPAGPRPCPGRLEVAAYLARYAARFGLPVELEQPVRELRRTPAGFLASTPGGNVLAKHVVLAVGPFARPHLPRATSGLEASVQQLHAAGYCRPADIEADEVLVVGGGNSAAQLAVELSATKRVTVASPGRPWFLPARVLGISIYWWIWLAGVLTSPSGSRVSRHVRRRGDAIIGRQLARLIRTGRVRLLPHRVVAGDGDRLVLADGTYVPVSAVLWCTGYRPALDWLQVRGALDADGQPLHEQGASPVPGLHWVGLPWQTRLDSSILHGIGHDARQTARRIAAGPA